MRIAALSHEHRVLRFTLTGLLSAGAQLVLLTALTLRGLPAILANGIAFLAAAQLNFVLSQFFTWRDRRAAGRLLGRWTAFHVAISGTALVNIGVFAAVKELAPNVVAAAAGILMAAVANFVIADYVVFTRRKGPAASGLVPHAYAPDNGTALQLAQSHYTEDR